MSFDIIIPCNCYKEGKMKMPPFQEKLMLYEGIWELKSQFNTPENRRLYDQWKFCEHNQVALEISMAQSGAITWKPYLKKMYPDQFLHLEEFFPDFNGYWSTGYKKSEALKELQELRILEGDKHAYRFDQFEKLLLVAIELDQIIYWS